MLGLGLRLTGEGLAWAKNADQEWEGLVPSTASCLPSGTHPAHETCADKSAQRAPRAEEPAPRARERPALFFSSTSPKQWQLQGKNNRKEPQTRWAETEPGPPPALEADSEKSKDKPLFFFSTRRNPLRLQARPSGGGEGRGSPKSLGHSHP